ncbi:MAG: 4-hydroxybenzoate octaprenyltransferase [Nitrospirae bacterium]|nr:4-hydroxybenzoate octaprenyltransferase [Nitrospirota bacterium]
MAAPGGPTRFWSALADLIRLRNQTGSFLLLFPTLWALVLAGEGHPPLPLVAIFTTGVFVMRSAGVAINDWWDRDLDRLVQRTRERPLASGRMQPYAALGVFGVLVATAAGLVSLLNPLTIVLAPIALLLAVLYPLAKRVMPLPQAVLGIAFGWGAVMAWSAVRNEVGWPALGLFAATVCWAIGYDTIYALQDLEDDQRIGVRSSALFFGNRCWIAVGGALLAMAAILGLVGAATHLAPSFYLSLVLAMGFFVAQARQVRRGVSQAQAFALFKQHVGIGTLILAGIWSGVLFR